MLFRSGPEDQNRDFSYTQNREISWLRFDDRVLDEAFDESVPLFERLKFCSIFESNLNEWFMGSFRPTLITPVDLFPQTFHVETVTLLSKD